ncbi:hypothetical protein LI328DRAFT_135435 [Trichoderma asperelloides]|nr:hypothetical protein LI328DRAFT_135435 [Trichoderma asperelloides]
MAANVNRPVDIKQKENDINRKLQIYGIFNAFKNGKTPSNEQIDVALNSFLESRALSSPSNKLSDDGKLLVEDAREVIKLAKQLLLSKNHGNLIQDFIWQTTHYDTKGVKSPNSSLTKDAATRDKDDALEGLRTLGTLLITNGQFRKLRTWTCFFWSCPLFTFFFFHLGRLIIVETYHFYSSRCVDFTA